MKFKDVDFQGKEKFQKSIRRSIYGRIDPIITLSEVFSLLAIERYLDILIEESDFNPKSRVFYNKISNTKITHDLFGKIASEYILEHIEDFKLKAGVDEM